MHPSSILRPLLSVLLLGLFSASAHAADAAAPFEIAVVPFRSSAQAQSIATADTKPDEFYVVLTNISNVAQPVFETWNSWGFQTVSFEFTTADGKKFYVLRREEDFTKNFPSAFLIQPGEHQVYPIRLDKEWAGLPKFTENGETPIRCVAIYQVSPTLAATEQKVWTGRIESKVYNLTLRHW